MKQVHVFHHEHYHHALERQMGKGITVFNGYRQKGGGLGSILGFIGRYALPLISKYILPHAGPAVMDTMSDIKNGRSIKTAIKSNVIKLAKNVGKSVLTPQSGAGFRAKKRKVLLSETSEQCSVSHSSHSPARGKKSPEVSPRKKAKKPKTKKQKSIFSKRDIFG